MNNITTLLTNGDSWTFGSEIMAPEFCAPIGVKGDGMAGRYKTGLYDHLEYNDYYREPRIWPAYLGQLLSIPTIVNIAQPSRSNDTIYETTISWLLNYIAEGNPTDELLVVIGWSSPERKNIIIGDIKTSWLTLWPSMPTTEFYSSAVVRDFFKFYVMHQWVEQEYLKRYIEQNFQLQTFCKLHNIKHYMFNAFYATPHNGPENWEDIDVINAINNWNDLEDGWGDKFYNWNSIKSTLLSQWNSLDHFVNKDMPAGSFRSHIYTNVEDSIRMCNWHPSPESHKAWAEYLATYIK